MGVSVDAIMENKTCWAATVDYLTIYLFGKGKVVGQVRIPTTIISHIHAATSHPL